MIHYMYWPCELGTMLRNYAVVALKFYLICLYFDNTLPKFPCLPIFLLTQMHGLRHYAWILELCCDCNKIPHNLFVLWHYLKLVPCFFFYIYNNRVICLLIKLLKVKEHKKKSYREMSSSLNYLFSYTSKMFNKNVFIDIIEKFKNKQVK
jgi:hypothetical protein